MTTWSEMKADRDRGSVALRAMVLEARTMYMAGEKLRVIAERFEVPMSTVNNWIYTKHFQPDNYPVAG